MADPNPNPFMSNVPTANPGSALPHQEAPQATVPGQLPGATQGQAAQQFPTPGLGSIPNMAALMQHPAAAQYYAAAFASMASQHQAGNIGADPTRPTFVNAKQYRRILKRRAAREVIEEYYRRQRSGAKRNRSYQHESRHKHACKRPRGPGGKFMTKVELEVYYAENPHLDPKNIEQQEQSSEMVGDIAAM